MIYILRDNECGETYRMALPDILTEINRDRSEDWTPYNETDWREGLSEWTYLEVIGEAA